MAELQNTKKLKKKKKECFYKKLVDFIKDKSGIDEDGLRNVHSDK